MGLIETIQAWDLSVLQYIAEHIEHAFLDLVFSVTHLADAGWFWIALSLCLMFFPKTRRAGFSMGLALLLGLILGNGVMKNAVGRIRPWVVDPTLPQRLSSLPSDASFPSGHTLASFEASVALFCRHKKWGCAALVLAVLIALSRLYFLVHFPTDVIFGAIMGTLLALLATLIVDRLWNFYNEKKKSRS